MKVVIQDNRRYVLRFDKGDDVIAGLKTFLAEQKIAACTFEGIGSCSQVELGYYNQHLKDYRHKPFVEDFEIISLLGNGGMEGAEPIIHAHGLFGRTDFTVLGGHVFKLIISATCEIFLIKLEGQLDRKVNSDWNLKLLV